MELRACVVVILAYGVKTLTTVPLSTTNVLSVVVGCLVLLWLEYRAQQNHAPSKHQVYRQDCGRGYYCTALIPLATILSMVQYQNDAKLQALQGKPLDKDARQGCLTLILYAIFLLVTSLAVDIQDVFKNDENSAKQCGTPEQGSERWTRALMTIIGLQLLVAVFYAMDHAIMNILGCWELCLLGLLSLLGVSLRTFLLQCLPGSFSAGEAAVVGHGGALFLFTAITSLLYQSRLIHPLPYHLSYDKEVIIFMQVALVSSLLVSWCLYKVPYFRGPFVYYPLVLVVMGGFSLPMLYTYLETNFVLWIQDYVTHSPTRVNLFIYWTLCCVISGFIVFISSNKLFSTVETKNEQSRPKSSNLEKSGQSTQADTEMNLKTVVRKYFHIFAVFVFLPGLLWDREMLCNGATCALIVFIMLEGLRLGKIPPFGSTLDQYFQALVDSRDGGHVILTHMYLLTGLALPLWIHPSPRNTGSLLALLSGVLSLGVGDTTAAIVGFNFGKHKWSGSKKSIEGTSAAVLSQLLMIYIIYLTGWLTMVPWMKVISAIITTSLLEAFTTQIDNLILPIFMFILLV